MGKIQAEKLNGPAVFACVCFCAAAVFMAALSVINLSGDTRWAPLALAGVTTLFFAAVFGIRGKGSRVGFALLLFALALLLKGAFALSIDTRPESDFYLMYSAAKHLSLGINSMTENVYFQSWPYQSAFVAWMALFMRLFNAGLVFFKLMNCLFSALSAVLVYLIARRFASERGARSAGVLFMCYPGTFVLVSVLTPQHLSEFLLLAAVYAFTLPAPGIKRKLLFSLAAGALLSLSNAARPVGMLAALALFAYIVIGAAAWLKNRRYGIAPLLARAAVLLTVYFVLTAGLSSLARLTGLNEYGLVNNVPEWKVIVGLNQESGGQYNNEDVDIVFNSGDPAAVKRLMDERLSISPGDFLRLAYRKAELLWGSYEPAFWAITENVLREAEAFGKSDLLQRAMRASSILAGAYYTLMNLLMAAGTTMVFKRRQLNEAYILLILIALAYFCAHTIIEVQVRYRSLMTVVTAPIMALGADALLACATGLKRGAHRKGQQR